MKFAIYFDAALSGGPVDGRVLLMISKSDDPEPRFQVRSGLKAIAVFGFDDPGDLDRGAVALEE